MYKYMYNTEVMFKILSILMIDVKISLKINPKTRTFLSDNFADQDPPHKNVRVLLFSRPLIFAVAKNPRNRENKGTAKIKGFTVYDDE